MKVLFVAGGLNMAGERGHLSGGAMVASRLSRSVLASGVAVTILNGTHGTTISKTDAHAGEPAVWHIPAFDHHDSDAAPGVSGAIREVLRECCPDVVHVFQYESWRWALFAAVLEKRIPVVATALDYGWFCPKSTLIKGDGSLCDGHPGRDKCRQCLSTGREPIVLAGRRLGRILPERLIAWPFVGDLIRDAKANRQRMDRALADWPRYRASVPSWIAPSVAMSNFLKQEGVAAEFVSHIPYGYDPPTGSPAKPPQHSIVFGYAGRGIYEKGFHLVAESFSSVAQRHANVRLRLFGISKGDRHRYTRQCLAKLGPVMGRVTFETYEGSDPASVSKAHTGITAMVVPSIWYDNLPLTVVESLANGTPVIASRHSSASDPVKDGTNGMLFDAFDARSLTLAMSRLVEDAALRERLLESTSYGRSSADEAAEITAVYRRLAGKP